MSHVLCNPTIDFISLSPIFIQTENYKIRFRNVSLTFEHYSNAQLKIIVSSLFHSIVFNEMVLRRKEECETWFAGPTLKMTLSSRTYIHVILTSHFQEIIVWINLIKILYIVLRVQYELYEHRTEELVGEAKFVLHLWAIWTFLVSYDESRDDDEWREKKKLNRISEILI